MLAHLGHADQDSQGAAGGTVGRFGIDGFAQNFAVVPELDRRLMVIPVTATSVAWRARQSIAPHGQDGQKPISVRSIAYLIVSPWIAR